MAAASGRDDARPSAWTARQLRMPLTLVLGLGLGLACNLYRDVSPLLERPLDPSRQVADLLLAHPARVPGEVLWVIGGSTQAVDFYSAYQVRWLENPPSRRPAQAALVETNHGWMFFPAHGPPS
jgi:hypothetical protein